MRKLIHRAIIFYLRICGKSFHSFSYSGSGRYVVLMNEREYHLFQKDILYGVPPSPPPLATVANPSIEAKSK